MKLYITHGAGQEQTGEGVYYIITEEGEILASHFCSHIGFAFGDLTYDRKEDKRISAWKERFGEVDILHLKHVKNAQNIEEELIEKQKIWTKNNPDNDYPKPSVAIKISEENAEQFITKHTEKDKER